MSEVDRILSPRLKQDSTKLRQDSTKLRQDSTKLRQDSTELRQCFTVEFSQEFKQKALLFLSSSLTYNYHVISHVIMLSAAINE